MSNFDYIYRECAENYRYYLDWRFRILTRHGITLGATLLVIQYILDSKSVPEHYCWIPLIGFSVASAAFLLMDVRHETLIHEASRIAAGIERQASGMRGSASGFYIYQSENRPWFFTHSLAFRALYGLSCVAGVLGALICLGLHTKGLAMSGYDIAAMVFVAITAIATAATALIVGREAVFSRRKFQFDTIAQSFDMLQRINEKALESNDNLAAVVKSADPDDQIPDNEARERYFHYMRINRVFHAWIYREGKFITARQFNLIIASQVGLLVPVIDQLDDLLKRGYPREFRPFLTRMVEEAADLKGNKSEKVAHQTPVYQH